MRGPLEKKNKERCKKEICAKTLHIVCHMLIWANILLKIESVQFYIETWSPQMT
jgi:hypothetical protein